MHYKHKLCGSLLGKWRKTTNELFEFHCNKISEVTEDIHSNIKQRKIKKINLENQSKVESLADFSSSNIKGALHRPNMSDDSDKVMMIEDL